jgi:hypothetical protein
MDLGNNAHGHADARRMDRLVHDAQARFNRVLVAWAGDVLELRRRGALVPQWANAPSAAAGQGSGAIQPMNDASKRAA